MLAGLVAVVVGAALAMGFAVAQTSCQDGPAGLLPRPALAGHCAGDAWGARIGFVVLVAGGLFVLLAGVRATPRYRPTEHQDPRPTGTAPESAGPETPSPGDHPVGA